MKDNHPPTPDCDCPVCSAPRFDKKAEYDEKCRPHLDAFIKACKAAGISYFTSACYGVQDREGHNGAMMGLHSTSGPMPNGWMPHCFKVAAHSVMDEHDGITGGPLAFILSKILADAD
jgi:hypothetical protein